MTAMATWLSQWQALLDEGRGLLADCTGQVRAGERTRGDANSPSRCCVMVSPHPDDESIVGALPLRLIQQGGWRVVNLAITQGSNPQRQLKRAAELGKACEVLGFENRLLAPTGLQRVSEQTRKQDPEHWANCKQALAQHIALLKPDLLVCPHASDAQAAHRGTYHLLLDVLADLPVDYSPLIALTEYWSTMEAPNLMVQVDAPTLAVQMSALMQHAGEIERTPYHLSLPAWMMDNVRRGAELVGRPGAEAPPYRFATLYRVMRWRSNINPNFNLQPAWTGGRFEPSGKNIELFLV